jgi:hypothetical protein
VPVTPETLAHIRADVQTAMVENRNTDPALMPDLLDYLLTELSKAAGAPTVAAYCPGWSGDEQVMDWAGHILEQVQLRAISQIPFGDRSTENDPDWRDHL